MLQDPLQYLPMKFLCLPSHDQVVSLCSAIAAGFGRRHYFHLGTGKLCN